MATITLDAPQRLNALSATMYRDLEAAIERFESDPEARVAILHGAGRSFCVGNDLKSMGRSSGGPPPSLWAQRERIRDHAQLWIRIWDCRKPVIAQVHGHCLAAGVMLAASCDLTFMADDCVVGWPKLPVGGGYISHLVGWYVGPKRAKEMSFMAGSEITGREAADWGLANRAFPPDELEAAVGRIARRIALMPADLLSLKKHSVNTIFDSRGYREAILDSAGRDAMSHQDPGIQEVRGWIGELGFKGAIERYEAEGLA